MEVTTDLLKQFVHDLIRRGIVINTIFGPWNDEFVSQVPSIYRSGPRLVLASETIYSPDSLRPFIWVLGNTPQAKSLIAAKKVYFGVGGGIDEFIREWELIGGGARPVMEVTDQGVARVVLDVYPKDPTKMMATFRLNHPLLRYI